MSIGQRDIGLIIYFFSLFIVDSFTVVSLETRISVLNQADNPIHHDKSCDHERVYHLCNELKNLKREREGKIKRNISDGNPVVKL